MVLETNNSTAAVLSRIANSARVGVEKGAQRLVFMAMGTQCSVTFHGVSDTPARQFCQHVVEWVAEFEARYSRFIPDSLISRINAAAGEHWVEIDPETEHLFRFCNELVFFTRGAFDPTSLPLIKLWNWKQRPPVIPESSAVAAARELVGWTKVEQRAGGVFLPRAGMCIDLGGIGKEYAVDRVMNIAEEHGVANVLVDFGQDVRVRGGGVGRDHWRVGLEDATKPGQCWVAVKAANHAVATSGDYFRCFEYQGRRYGHVVDPRTGYPVNNGCRAVSVVAPSCTLAGILTTSAMILGPKEGLHLIESHLNAEGAITTDNNRIYTRRFHEYVAS